MLAEPSPLHFELLSACLQISAVLSNGRNPEEERIDRRADLGRPIQV